MNNKKTIFLSFFIIILLSNTLIAQTENLGELNVWTDKKVSREKSSENTIFRGLEVIKQKEFDRVTFKFKDDLPNWEIEYVNPPILLAETGRNAKIAGKAFVRINFNPVPNEEIPQNSFFQIPPQKLKLFFIKEVQNILTVNEYSYAVGLKTKTLFRVQQLSNPARLVIDFKH
jgi:hypothetical protein